MDVLGTLPVRFHFRGGFINDGKKLHYCGGRKAMSYLDRDKISVSEVVGHLKDHCSVLKGILLHWLLPGKELMNGLRVLVDDQVCQEMANTIVGGVAEIYVEDPHVEEIPDDSDGVDELEDRIISDSDYIPGDLGASDDDEEGAEIEKKFKDFEKKLRSDYISGPIIMLPPWDSAKL